MNLALSELELPLRLRSERPLTDEELMRFCAENEPLRVEREANGELIVMSPGGTDAGEWSSMSRPSLEVGRRRTDAAGPLVQAPESRCQTAPFAQPTPLGSSGRDGTPSPREQQQWFAPICPEFVNELRSPSDKLPELQAKMQQRIGNGAHLAWLVNPLRPNRHHLPPWPEA